MIIFIRNLIIWFTGIKWGLKAVWRLIRYGQKPTIKEDGEFEWIEWE